MRITYSDTDPRRGMTVEIDEGRARALIDSGAAKKASSSTTEPADSGEPARAVAPVTAVPAKTAARTAAKPASKKAR